LPEHGTFVSDPVNIISPRFELGIDVFDMERDDIVVLYKYADSLQNLDNKG
jgi:hypothetical protein